MSKATVAASTAATTATSGERWEERRQRHVRPHDAEDYSPTTLPKGNITGTF